MAELFAAAFVFGMVFGAVYLVWKILTDSLKLMVPRRRPNGSYWVRGDEVLANRAAAKRRRRAAKKPRQQGIFD